MKTLLLATTATVGLSAFACGTASALPTAATSPTSFTTSTAEVDTIIDTPVTVNLNAYSTTLTAQLEGGPVIYDQTFAVPFADPVFQSAIGTASADLTAAGAVSILGPNLTSSTNTTTTTTSTVETGTSTSLYFNAELFTGPQTINVGDFGVCQSYTLDGSGHPLPTGSTIGGTPFTLGVGQIDFDGFELTLVDVFTTTTTTNTDLLTQDWELIGVPAVVAAPEPRAWTLLGVGLLGMAWLRRKNLARLPPMSFWAFRRRPTRGATLAGFNLVH
jgi:hypothetical protein